mmetsp:Transcript_37028/g.116487  ORF Transcript_37028/g.116487 Transcript_37028/m.116487 type:complete len:221 (-) Transcript_37028:239-901(-)
MLLDRLSSSLHGGAALLGRARTARVLCPPLRQTPAAPPGIQPALARTSQSRRREGITLCICAPPREKHLVHHRKVAVPKHDLLDGLAGVGPAPLGEVSEELQADPVRERLGVQHEHGAGIRPVQACDGPGTGPAESPSPPCPSGPRGPPALLDLDGSFLARVGIFAFGVGGGENWISAVRKAAADHRAPDYLGALHSLEAFELQIEHIAPTEFSVVDNRS